MQYLNSTFNLSESFCELRDIVVTYCSRETKVLLRTRKVKRSELLITEEERLIEGWNRWTQSYILERVFGAGERTAKLFVMPAQAGSEHFKISSLNITKIFSLSVFLSSRISCYQSLIYKN